MRLTGFRQKFSAVLGYPPKECISKKREKEETMMLVIKKKKKEKMNICGFWTPGRAAESLVCSLQTVTPLSSRHSLDATGKTALPYSF